MADSGTQGSAEVRRLQEELAAARKRLEAEESRFQARLENQRTRLEAEGLRQQAAEVSRRRQLEQEVSALHERLANVDVVSPDAAAEWRQRNAELENELAAEQRNSVSLEQELMLTRQALNLSERARATARGRALRLAEVLRELRHQIEQTAGGRFSRPTKPFDGTQVGAGNIQEVDLGRANAVLLEVERALDRDDSAQSDDTGSSRPDADEGWLEGFLDMPEDQSFAAGVSKNQVDEPQPRQSAAPRPPVETFESRPHRPPPTAVTRPRNRRGGGLWQSLRARLPFVRRR